MIDRLREVLGAVSPHGAPDARELSELLWLAAHIAPAGDEPAAPAPEPAPPVAAAPPPPGPDGLAEPPGPAPEPRAALHHRPATGTAPPAGAAAEVLVPTAPMLSDPLGVQRALRPVKRRVPSRHRRELDEDATAERIADTRLWTPVLVPESERWLALTLVVDTGPTMRLWRPLARELAETLLRQGAFQNVGVAYLTPTGRVSSAPGSPPRAPGTLQDASGRHAVLLLSDCSGPHWWNGRAAPAVRRWAQAGPTAILQPLAESLWRRTAAPTTPGVAVLPRPGGPNTGLRFTPHDGAPPPGVPVPVLEVAPRWFGAWARLVSGAGPQPAAIAALPSGPSGPAPSDRDVPVAERVRRFLRTASSDAAELAAHVAVSVPSLPVMRLIQHGVLGGSDPGRLAEVLLSGLLRPLDDVRYEFVPGAREALLDTLPRPEAQHTRRVLEAVSAEIERRAGAAETFRALLATADGPLTLTADTPHFALLTAPATSAPPAPVPPAPNLLDVLGTPLDDLIGDGWDRPGHPTAVGVDGTGETVRVDLLRDGRDMPHGTIVGRRAERDRVLRTLLFSLALGHSPATAALAFADFSGGASFVGLGSLPHVVTAVHSMSIDSPLFPRLLTALEAERARRETLRSRAQSTRDRSPATSPALVVVIDNVAPLLGARPELQEPLFRLCEEGPAQGIRFVLCSPDETDLPFLPRWRITVPGPDGGDSASLTTTGADAAPVTFRPAHIALTESDPIVARMRERGPRAPRLPWPDEPAEPAAPSSDAGRPPPRRSSTADDVLALNGAGLEAAFTNAWRLPVSIPRLPNIGHDPDGNGFAAPFLDLASGESGLVVGDNLARQHILRVIALALAAKHPPSQMTFAFAGLGGHPLGETFSLPHVLYSDEELLGRPHKLQEFIDFLSAELATRRGHASPEDLPHLVLMADVSLTFPSSRGEVGETLLQAAQRGKALGVKLILASSTVENTTIWSRFLPFLDWRIAANRLPPAELRTVLGQASLSFPDGDAYSVVTGDAPRRFTPARLPSERGIAAFAEQATDRTRPAIPLSAEAKIQRIHEFLDRVPESTDRTTIEAFRELARLEIGTIEAAEPDAPRHVMFEGRHCPEMRDAARLYGQMLAETGLLEHGHVTEPSRTAFIGEDAGGGVLFVRGEDLFSPATGELMGAAAEALTEAVRRGTDPVVVLCVEDQRTALLREAPELIGHFERSMDFSSARFRDRAGDGDETAGAPASGLPDVLHASELPEIPGRRIPIGIADRTHEPVLLDLEADRHLLISGPPDTGRAALVRLLIGEIATRHPAPERVVYLLDPNGRLSEFAAGLEQDVLGRYGRTPAEIAEIMGAVRGDIALRRRLGQGIDVYLVMTGRVPLVATDPLPGLLPSLEKTGYNGLHLILNQQESPLHAPPDPVAQRLHELGAPAVLTGSSGQEARLWGVPRPGGGRGPRGRATFSRRGRHRLMQLAEPD
ncbi:hypothetical protein GCM10009527_038700 [Actinomadura nitritigenes]|uniref:FtsK domain-containing protein n=1 Tax=Actinomadura nitritigenes TaxID=134602 RepID=A0ABS3QR63_9ACTN|nr:SAV_2336 N-terminal domain-related protein [Actinomadura nitritigenes]MBO2436396.1 hypothetical protein [Actinomadura nitritigenes]